MLFNSIQYILFLPIVFLCFYGLRQRHRWKLLLAASYYFYMCWKPEYAVLILISTIVDYYSGIRIGNTNNYKVRKIFLCISLLINLGLLFSFKYLNFFCDQFNAILLKFNVFSHVPEYDLLLPVGISFYTFQSLSYTIDIYRNKRAPEYHFGIFALYVSFFPQLVAGPIERSSRLIPQFYKHNKFKYEDGVIGTRQILWGFFKKLVVADRCAIYVDAVFNNPAQFNGSTIWLASFFFVFQLYCDFSGYSDIAIGSARLLGFRLMRNFNRPLFSKSMREFWQRWHISLSTWFKDYLYIPLGGSRVGLLRWYNNIFITFTISGIWHGAAWTFIIWGALHGLYLVLEDILSRLKTHFNYNQNYFCCGLFENLKILRTFILFQISLIFFRSNNVDSSFVMIGKLFDLDGFPWLPRDNEIATPIYALIGISILLFVEMNCEWKNNNIFKKFSESKVVRYSSYIFIAVWILLTGVFDGGQFIYFEF